VAAGAVRRARRVSAGAALLAAAAVLLACPAQQGGPPAPSAPLADPSDSAAGADPSAAPTAVEPGFINCCGSARYRIEIECGEMLKRCYEREAGEWRQTYGRHCKEELGESCYLDGCDSRCR